MHNSSPGWTAFVFQNSSREKGLQSALWGTYCPPALHCSFFGNSLQHEATLRLSARPIEIKSQVCMGLAWALQCMLKDFSSLGVAIYMYRCIIGFRKQYFTALRDMRDKVDFQKNVFAMIHRGDMPTKVLSNGLQLPSHVQLT
jgi:hypothetical protein